MADKKDKQAARADAGWPKLEEGSHAVSEFNADRQGALSPFGEVEFPVDPNALNYIHPTTVINR